MSGNPFHAGEHIAQQRTGSSERVGSYAREMIRPFLPKQHRDFYQQLPFVIATARDHKSRPWTTVLAGAPGFIRADGDRCLDITAQPTPTDPLANAFLSGADVGLLGIEAHTRRRNRANGRLISTDDGQLHFETRQSFGNCPQYIQERHWKLAATETSTPETRTNNFLDTAQSQWISAADTFFIGSGYDGEPNDSEANGMDSSHRGGPAGFVEVLTPTTLMFPDYSGNKHFNTIGNLIKDPRIALLFINFEHGHLLQLTGSARIDWDSEAVAQRPGAERLIVVDIDQVVEQRSALPIRWHSPEQAPLQLRVVGRQQESSSITSFLLESADGADLPSFVPGQHLPISIPGLNLPSDSIRTYSLSNAPSRKHFRISVKREPRGRVSRLLHDRIEPGHLLDAWLPGGDFKLEDSQRPAILISAGVGITPMMSMLEHLAITEPSRKVIFLHGSRTTKERAFSRDIKKVSQRRPGIQTRLLLSQPDISDEAGEDYDALGRVSAADIQEMLPGLDGEFYLCGPGAMISSIAAELRQLGVAEEDIRFETFGPT